MIQVILTFFDLSANKTFFEFGLNYCLTFVYTTMISLPILSDYSVQVIIFHIHCVPV